MSTLAEIEAAADGLPPEEKQELILFLAAQLRAETGEVSRPRRLLTEAQVLAAIEASPIRFESNWEALKAEVR
jgi:hypothetical protein